MTEILRLPINYSPWHRVIEANAYERNGNTDNGENILLTVVRLLNAVVSITLNETRAIQ